MRCANIYFIGFVILSIAVTGCNKCSKDAPSSLAQLIGTEGQIERDFSKKIGNWQQAPLGSEFYIGDGVRSGNDSKAILQLINGSLFKLVAHSQLRFLHSLKGVNNNRVDLGAGESDVVVGDKGLRLEIGPALIVFDAHSQANLKRKKEKIKLKINIGKATIYTREGELSRRKIFENGSLVMLGLNSGQIEQLEADASVPHQIDDTEETSSAEQSLDTQAVSTLEEKRLVDENGIVIRKLNRADFSAPAGSSFTVHVSRPPVVVSFDTRKCPGKAYVGLGKSNILSYQGEKTVNVKFSTGKTSYSVFCSQNNVPNKKPLVKGKVVVLRDSGKMKVPRSAPSSFVEADGRTYKISYQNLLPNVSFRWSNAPEATSYNVHLKTNGITKGVFKTTQPFYSFKSGQLKEGTHQLKFEAPDAVPRFSRRTKVKFIFNNAAPKASIFEPNDNTFSEGSTVHVKGLSSMGWHISIAGGGLFVDKQYRFSGRVHFSGKYDALAIRLSHPKRGVHYYLRRSKK